MTKAERGGSTVQVTPVVVGISNCDLGIFSPVAVRVTNKGSLPVVVELAVRDRYAGTALESSFLSYFTYDMKNPEKALRGSHRGVHHNYKDIRQKNSKYTTEDALTSPIKEMSAIRSKSVGKDCSPCRDPCHLKGRRDRSRLEKRTGYPKHHQPQRGPWRSWRCV